MPVLRVDPIVGRDINSYAAVAGGAAWQTLNHARTQALQGDTIDVYDNGANYLYTAPATNNRFLPAFQLANGLDSPDAGARITVRKAGNFRVNLGATGGAGPVIGGSNRRFISWEGFHIDEANYQWQSDTGPCVFAGGTDNRFERIHVQGRPDAALVQDNHNAFRFEDEVRPRLRNCTVVDFYQGGWGNWNHNNSGCMLYGVRDYLIEHNDFTRCGSGLFPKGTTQSGTFHNYGVARFNQFRQCGKALRTTFLDATLLSEFYQNLIWDAHPDPDFNNQRVAVELNETSRNIHLYNNTFVMRTGLQSNTTDGSHFNVRQYNNIFHSDGTVRVVNLGESNSIWEHDYNYYFNSLGWSLNAANYASIQDWRAVLGGAGAWNDNNSLVADPLFADIVGGDFRLQAGSPARTAGLLGDPIGAYRLGTETIGVTLAGGGSSPSGPSGPYGSQPMVSRFGHHVARQQMRWR